jgi:bifunctional non-homologous end joining protein LigD
LLELAAKDEAEGLGDAPWPPHFRKQEGEAKRVQPSKAKKFSDQLGEGFGSKRFRKPALKKEAASDDASLNTPDTPAPAKKPRKPRASTQPLITIANSTDKSAAEAGLDRWKAAHPEAAQHLAVDDILVDRMRGSSSIWYRIRVNLRHVPEEIRPTQQTPDPDEDPTRAWREEQHR